MPRRAYGLPKERLLLLGWLSGVTAAGVQDLATEADGAVHPDVADGGALDEVPRRVRALCLHCL